MLELGEPLRRGKERLGTCAALLIFCLVIGGALSPVAAADESPWRKTWHGDAGLSARVPSECGLPTNSVVRLYGDSWTDKSVSGSGFERLALTESWRFLDSPWFIKFGTNIILDSTTTDRSSDPTIAINLPGVKRDSKGFLVTDKSPSWAPANWSGNLVWPGAPFFADSADGKSCKLTFYGERANFKAFGKNIVDSKNQLLVRLDVRDLRTPGRAVPSVTQVPKSTSNWTFGTVQSSSSQESFDFLLRAKSTTEIEFGRPNPDGSVNPAGTLRLPAGGLATSRGSRGSVVSDNGRWYFISTPAYFGSLLYAMPMSVQAPPSQSTSLTAKKAFALIPSIKSPNGCQWVYDPVIHPDLMRPDGSLTLSASFSPNLLTNPKNDCGNSGYGNYEYSGFWPRILGIDEVRESARQASYLLRTSRRTAAAAATDHMTIELWPAKLQRSVEEELSGGSYFDAGPDFSENPAWDVSCTFLVPNSSAEYEVQQRAAAAAQAAYIAARESWNGKRIVDSAQSVYDRAAQAYLATPTKANLDKKTVAATRLREATAMWGRIASAYGTRQIASVRAQLAACGQGRTSWTD